MAMVGYVKSWITDSSWAIVEYRKVSDGTVLMSELAKEEGLKPLDNVAAYRLWSPYEYGDATQKLMSLLEPEEERKRAQPNVNS